MVGDYHYVGLIENAEVLVVGQYLRDQRIGYRFEVVDLHRKRIAGQMGVQIDPGEVHNLDFRNAMILDGIEQLGHGFLVEVFVDIHLFGRILATAARDEFRVQRDHRDRID